MKLQKMMMDVDAVDNGAWVESTLDESVKWKVRGSEYPPYQKALRAKIAHHTQRRGRAKALDPEFLDKISNELIAEHLLVDWQGIESPEGDTLPYSMEQAMAFMTDRKLIPAARDIKMAIDEVDSGNADTREEVAGN